MTVYVCSSSSCRKQKTARKALLSTISNHRAQPKTVGCQKVCNGPVVGCEVEGRLEWFERLDSRKALRALDKLFSRGEVSKPLRKRRAKKRAGKLR